MQCACFLHVTDVTADFLSDMSDMRFFLSLHGEVLIISELYASCNECNEVFNLNEFIQSSLGLG